MENLPIDIVLVRHGESEGMKTTQDLIVAGNLAQFQSKKGDDSLWTPDFSKRY